MKFKNRSIIIVDECPLSSTKTLLELIKTSLENDKADNTVIIDLVGKTAIADFLVIASGTSHRHVGALANHIQRQIKALGLKNIAIEGLKHCDWVLIDAGDIIIHLFRPEVRYFYNLEKIWLPEITSDSSDTILV